MSGQHIDVIADYADAKIADLEHKLEVQEKKYREISKRLSRKVFFLKKENERLREALTPAERRDRGSS